MSSVENFSQHAKFIIQALVKTRGPWATICSPDKNSYCIFANAMQHSSSIATATAVIYLQFLIGSIESKDSHD